ncbi:MAG: glycerol-3-phosphate dehydrogenase [Acidobacteria bacterium]|jgi:glycerol-3-phosphate dehydrogenase (NAD(P)+)|nr:MAG: glycerol-3-phosphate dehydrogenase [Acidobacteriota bacterium]
MKVAIIGAGAFGTAMAITATRGGNDVVLWAHDPDVAQAIRETGENPDYLPGIGLGAKVVATSDLAEAVAFSDTIVMMTPSHYYRDVLTRVREHASGALNVISGTKGIENDSLQRMSEITRDVLGEKLRAFAVLSGPTFALEVARGDPTAAVVASTDVAFAQDVQNALSSPAFRLYHSEDVVGVELSGSLKNVIAIAAGVLDGLGLGYNTNAALITRGLREMTRLGLVLGGRIETFAGLAGMGDLVLTCTGALSRNRTVGVLLGQGRTLDDILRDAKFVAEGVKTSKSAKQLADRHQIEMPITDEMFRVLYEGESARLGVQRLMTRALKSEMA